MFLNPGGTHFRMRFMVSLRSFPWNGNAPVSISNWERKHKQCNQHTYLRNIYAQPVRFFSSLPLVPRTTTSRRCGCVPACSRPLVPCTPQCHRRNKLSSHDQWLLYTGRNLKTHKTLTKDPDHTHYYSSTITATKSFNMKQFSHKSSVKATS